MRGSSKSPLDHPFWSQHTFDGTTSCICSIFPLGACSLYFGNQQCRTHCFAFHYQLIVKVHWPQGVVKPIGPPSGCSQFVWSSLFLLLLPWLFLTVYHTFWFQRERVRGPRGDFLPPSLSPWAIFSEKPKFSNGKMFKNSFYSDLWRDQRWRRNPCNLMQLMVYKVPL